MTRAWTISGIVLDGLGQHHDAGVAERADVVGEVEHDLGALVDRGGDARLIGDRHVGLAGEHRTDLGAGAHLQDRDVGADLEPGVLDHLLGDGVVGVGIGRGDDGQTLEVRRIGDLVEVLGDAEIVRTLDDGADDHAGAARLAAHHGHGGVADGEVGRAAEHGRKGLRVAAGGGDVHLQPVLLEDPGMHADIKVDVAEVVDGLAEVDLLEVLRLGNRCGADCAGEGDACCDENALQAGGRGLKPYHELSSAGWATGSV